MTTLNTQQADSLTIRDAATNERLGEIKVGSRAVLCKGYTGTIRSLCDVQGMDSWAQSITRDMSAEERKAFYGREVKVADEYLY